MDCTTVPTCVQPTLDVGESLDNDSQLQLNQAPACVPIEDTCTEHTGKPIRFWREGAGSEVVRNEASVEVNVPTPTATGMAARGPAPTPESLEKHAAAAERLPAPAGRS